MGMMTVLLYHLHAPVKDSGRTYNKIAFVKEVELNQSRDGLVPSSRWEVLPLVIPSQVEPVEPSRDRQVETFVEALPTSQSSIIILK